MIPVLERCKQIRVITDGEKYIPMYNNSALLTSNTCFK